METMPSPQPHVHGGTHPTPTTARPSPPPSSSNRRDHHHMPFIMPDGRPLTVFLTENDFLTRSPSGSGGSGGNNNKQSKRRKEQKQNHGWSNATTTTTTTHPRIPQQLTDAERAELTALDRVGQRRQRRYLNDKLLRDMAPALTAKDMESLFKPAPFGETGHVSPFTQAALPENAGLWELFRSVDSDRQDRVLAKFEEHIRELKSGASGAGTNIAGVNAEATAEAALQQAAMLAMKGWAGISPRGRRALRRAPRGAVHEVESMLMSTLYGGPGETVVLALEDAFQRLIVHAIAQFHFLHSASRSVGGSDQQVSDQSMGKRKEVVVRRRRQSSKQLQEGSTSTSTQFASLPCITCVDVLGLLDEQQQQHEDDGECMSVDSHATGSGVGLSLRSLVELMRHPHHIHLHHHQQQQEQHVC